MDFALRCNSLKCRAQLTERAVVTTCSHIFCNPCSDALGLTAPAGGNRICPACQSALPNPDDAVSTSLNPTDDYKTSVLSGLAPSIIIECAGRGLAFWSYQSTQEIVYQEYLAKTLTDKYGSLNTQVDKIINDANSELEILNQKISNMQIDQDRLKAENINLVGAYREKSRKHQQTQELYDRLKRKEMTAATQSAAFDSVDEVLGNASSRQGFGNPAGSHHHYTPTRPQANRDFEPFQLDHNGVERVHTHQRSGSAHSQDNRGMMPPPTLRRVPGIGTNAFDLSNPTPSGHRIQLGPTAQYVGHPSASDYRQPNSAVHSSNGHHTPSQRRPLASLNANSVNGSGLRGYGMSAGAKVGRQQASRFGGTNPPNQVRYGDQQPLQTTQQRYGNMYF